MLVLYRGLQYNTELKTIITVSLLSEIGSLILVYHDLSINYAYNTALLLHHTLWLLLIVRQVGYRGVGYLLPGFFFVFGIFNLIFGEGIDNFNCNTFVIGSFMYLGIFIVESFRQLKRENFDFFSAPSYLMLFAPVMFFLGLSFEFSFRNYELGNSLVLGLVRLYTFISYFVNIIYYTFLIIYIIKINQPKYAK
ncbi:MAG: hypothetical protein ACOVRN_12945 [Flavobacterium sp.]